MYSKVIKEARDFMFSYLENKNIDYEVIYPWRKDKDFIILHSLRVHSYALQIIENEDLTEEEKLIIELACFLHDIGRANDTKKGHAKVSAKIVNEWIEENHIIKNYIKDINRLIYVIETHSDKDVEDNDICSIIMKDADLLDEVGILSVFMQAFKLDNQNSFYFNDILEKVKSNEIEFCERLKIRLKTKTALNILDEKINFFYILIKQFENELKGTEEYYNKSKS